MIFPATMADMLRGGYVFLQTKECRDCRELMHLFRTPRGRVAYFVKTPRGKFVSHFATKCPSVEMRLSSTVAINVGQCELFQEEAF